jgi:hypothetical protein
MWTPVRLKKTRQDKKLEPLFRFNRNGKGSRAARRAGIFLSTRETGKAPPT